MVKKSETSDGETLTKAYEYDAAGNRDIMRVSGTETYTTDYAYDLNNRLKTETKEYEDILKTETAEYEYDKNGNQISKTTFTTRNSGGAEEVGIYELGSKLPMPREDYTVEINKFNVFNQLVQVQNDEGTSIYAYKSDGLRLSKNVNGALTTHIGDGQNIVMEYGAVNDVYLRGINLIKSDQQGYYLYNAHGDVVQRTNSSGTLIKSYVYDAFGNDTRTTNSGGMGSTGSVIDDGDTNPFRYAGEYTDFKTGSIYLRNRVYDPSTGIFTSEDPIRADLNWYSYCGGNPVLYVDPSGLDSYIYYDPNTGDGTAEYMPHYRQGIADQFYDGDISRVRLISLASTSTETSADILRRVWAEMAEDNSIEAIVMHGHANWNRMLLSSDDEFRIFGSDGQMFGDSININSLDAITTDYFVLLGCSPGNAGYDYDGTNKGSANFASEIVLGKHTINNAVIAADDLTYSYNNGKITTDGLGFRSFSWNSTTGLIDTFYLGHSFSGIQSLIRVQMIGSTNPSLYQNPHDIPAAAKKKG